MRIAAFPLVDLDPALRLLFSLRLAVRLRDPVLVEQIAAFAERTLSTREMRRAFSRLPGMGCSEEELTWLRSRIA